MKVDKKDFQQLQVNDLVLLSNNIRIFHMGYGEGVWILLIIFIALTGS